MNKPSINGPRSAKPFIVVEAETRSELESKVEAAWREGYRPSGGIAINRDPVNHALYYLQGMTLEEGPSTCSGRRPSPCCSVLDDDEHV